MHFLAGVRATLVALCFTLVASKDPSASSELATALAAADALRHRGDFEKAASGYRAAAEAFPDRAEPHFFLGLTARSVGDTAAALTHYRDALQISPSLAEVNVSWMPSPLCASRGHST